MTKREIYHGLSKTGCFFPLRKTNKPLHKGSKASNPEYTVSLEATVEMVHNQAQ